MIQSMKCKITIHNDQQILGVCHSAQCKTQNRLVCFKCLQQHLESNFCQIQDIKDEQELCAIIKEYISFIDTRYDYSIKYCQTQKIMKIKELQNYFKSWQDGYKKFDYLETIINRFQQDKSSIKLELYLNDNNYQYKLDQYLNNQIAQFIKIEKFMKGHPNFMIDQEIKLQESEHLNSIQDALQKLNDKIQQNLQMNEEEILQFIKNQKEYQINTYENIQYQLGVFNDLSMDDLTKDNQKNIFQLKFQFYKNSLSIQGSNQIGLLDELLEFYNHIIQKFPRNQQALENLGNFFKDQAKIYVQKKQYKNAVQQYDKCIQINPYEYRLYQNKANLLLHHLNNVNDALKCYEEYCKIDNTNYNANIQKAQIYQKQNNYSKALECFNEYVKIDPNYHKKQQFQKAFQNCCDQSIKYDQTNHKLNYITYMKKCQSHLLEKDFNKALQLYIDYISLDINYFKKADLVNAILECCNQYINFDKTSMIAYMTKSNVLSKKKQYLSAINCYDNYIQNNNNHQKNVYFLSILQCCDLYIDSDKQNYLRYFLKAQILQQKKDLNPAFQCYDSYIQINPNYNQINDFFQALLKCCDQYISSIKQNPLPYIKKAQILQQKKDYKAALQCYDKYQMLNENYHQQNEFYQALIQCCDQYIKNDTSNHLGYVKKGKILQQQKDFQAAFQCYFQYIHINANYYQNDEYCNALMECYDQDININEQNYLTHIQKAKLLQQKKDFKAAFQCYLQIIQLAPQQFLRNQEFYINFIICCDQCITHDKKDYIPYLKKASILITIGKIQDALDCYDKCVKESNNQYEPTLNKGQLLKQEKKYKEAIQCFDKYIQLDPQKKEAKQIKKATEDLRNQEQQCVIF